MGGLSNFIVAVEGDDFEANRKLVDALVKKYETLPSDYVFYMRHQINEERAFYDRYKHLYIEKEDLQEIYVRLREKIRHERIRNNPVLNIDFDGDETEPVDFDISDIREKYQKKTAKYDKYLDGYFNSENGRL